MGARFNRVLRAVIGLASFVAGIGVAFFVIDNAAQVTVHLQGWTADLKLWEVGLVPLAVGIGLGYLYHLPARLHHVFEHFRHRSRVQELEKENRELRSSLDKVLAMPGGTDGESIPAALLPPIDQPEEERLEPLPLDEPELEVVALPAPEPRRNRKRATRARAELAKAELAKVEQPAKPARKTNGHRPRVRAAEPLEEESAQPSP